MHLTDDANSERVAPCNILGVDHACLPIVALAPKVPGESVVWVLFSLRYENSRDRLGFKRYYLNDQVFSFVELVPDFQFVEYLFVLFEDSPWDVVADSQRIDFWRSLGQLA